MNNHILVISPIPSHPQIQGNSARIYRLGKLWQSLGYKVHFLYFGLEGLKEREERDMKQCWDFFYYLQPTSRISEPGSKGYFDIDDWYDDRVSELVTALCSIWQFRACLVNYVWFSKAFESVPSGPLKILDTHDIFGDRHLIAEAAGIPPVWFYTTQQQEKQGLNRADLVIAIQDQESEYFESLTDARVEVIGCVLPPNYVPVKVSSSTRKLRVGFIGSGNPFNENSVRCLQDAVSANHEALNNFEFHLAGTICKVLGCDNSIFQSHGVVERVTDFYREVDIVVNPMVGGTGLKIKSVEAISHGKPLIATSDAMAGIRTDDNMHMCTSVSNLVSRLATLNQDDLLEMAATSINIHQQYNQAQLRNFKSLFGLSHEFTPPGSISSC